MAQAGSSIYQLLTPYNYILFGGTYECETEEETRKLHTKLVEINGNIIVNYKKLYLDG